MLFQIPFLAETSLTDLTLIWTLINMGSKVISNITTLFEYFMTSLIETTKVASIFMRMNTKQFYYINHIAWNALQFQRHVSTDEAVLSADVFFYFFEVVQELFVYHVGELGSVFLSFLLPCWVKWFRTLYYILQIKALRTMRMLLLSIVMLSP